MISTKWLSVHNRSKFKNKLVFEAGIITFKKFKYSAIDDQTPPSPPKKDQLQEWCHDYRRMLEFIYNFYLWQFGSAVKHPFPMDTQFGSVTILGENHEIEASDDICKIRKD